MPKSKTRKKSLSKKAETKTKKTKLTKTARDKKIEEYCDWVTDKEFPMQFRNQFPTWIDDVDKYLETLKVSSEQYEPSFELEEDTKLFQAYRYGYAVGFYEGVTQVLERVKEIKLETTKLNDEKVNQLANNKIFKFLKEKEKEDPKRKISKDEVLEAGKLTLEDLEKAGIEDIERYISDGPTNEQEPKWISKFDKWWAESHGKDQAKEGKLTYEDLDRYSYITYGTHLGDTFSSFDKFIKDYCFSRKRVGFWHTDAYGIQHFYFDVTNQEELDTINKEFEIQKAKKLLEEEGVIEPV